MLSRKGLLLLVYPVFLYPLAMTKQQIDEEVKKITAQLIEKYKPEKIILFGSAARGEDANDLDFLIIKNEVPYYGIDRMREVRRLVNKTEAADFLVVKSDEWQKQALANSSFYQTVNREGKVLYG